jgi:hypothetical protein
LKQKKWQRFANNNPEEFLKANITGYSSIDFQLNPASKDIIASSCRNVLASIVVSAKEQIKKSTDH